MENNKNNKVFTLYIVSVCIAVFVTLVIFAAVFLSDIIAPTVDSIISNDEPNTTEDGGSNKLTVSQETENYEALISKYANYLSSSYLTVVNHENPLPEDYSAPQLSSISNSARQIEEKAAAALEQLFAAADEAGFKKHVVLSGYRTADEQTAAYNSKVQSYMSSGYTQTESETRAALTVAKAGESEYQTGLLVEISESRNMTSDDFVNSGLYGFLKENAHLYGFILRYPEGKNNVTGYDFNSMIFRYVGSVDSSTYIYENNLTLEEYLDYIKIAKLDAEQELEFLKHE